MGMIASDVLQFVTLKRFDFKILRTLKKIIKVTDLPRDTYEPRHEKTNILHMRKQKRRSASR